METYRDMDRTEIEKERIRQDAETRRLSISEKEETKRTRSNNPSFLITTSVIVMVTSITLCVIIDTCLNRKKDIHATDIQSVCVASAKIIRDEDKPYLCSNGRIMTETYGTERPSTLIGEKHWVLVKCVCDDNKSVPHSEPSSAPPATIPESPDK